MTGSQRISANGLVVGLTVCLVVLTLVVVFTSLNDINLFLNDVSASGKIVSCQIEHSNRGGNFCEAAISFETRSGQHIIFHEATGDSTVGTVVNVRYRLDDPYDAHIDRLSGDLVLAGILVGLLALDLGAFWLWQRRKAREYVLLHKGYTKAKKRRNVKKYRRKLL